MRNQPSTRKHHVIYKTTCVKTGAFYVGMHSTDDLNDRYLGSGIILNNSIRKYGRENHLREILELLPSRKELKIREEELVDQNLLDNPKCMNITHGGGGAGLGSKNPFYKKHHTKASKLKIAQSRIGKVTSPAVVKKLSEASTLALSKPYLVIDPAGLEHHITGLKTFCRQRGLIYTSLHVTIKSGKPTAGAHPGWLVRRA